MKTIKMLLLATPLLLIPISSSAGLLSSFFSIFRVGTTTDFADDTNPAPVPEPSGALVMGVALATVLVAQRRLRK